MTIMSALANKVRSHPWVCIPHVFGTKKLTAITNITKANPVTVTSPGHNWENGEKVLIYSVSGMTQLNQNVYTVEQLRLEATEHWSLLASTALASARTQLPGSWPHPTISTIIAREVALLAAHFRDHVDPL